MGRLNSEQLPCITSANLRAICVADCGVIQPLRCNDHILEWVIDGVAYAVGADFHDDFGECLRAEITARDDIFSVVMPSGS
jgi:hypothetical protein